jgi:hypothetical protein
MNHRSIQLVGTYAACSSWLFFPLPKRFPLWIYKQPPARMATILEALAGEYIPRVSVDWRRAMAVTSENSAYPTTGGGGVARYVTFREYRLVIQQSRYGRLLGRYSCTTCNRRNGLVSVNRKEARITILDDIWQTEDMSCLPPHPIWASVTKCMVVGWRVYLRQSGGLPGVRALNDGGGC